MKKFLSTAMVLGALYGTANAATITSPIYMPEAGKLLSEISIGYTTSEYDKVPEGAKDELHEAWNIAAEGKLGLMNRLSLNYGFEFDFAQKYNDEDRSAAFNDFYFGLTGRVLDIDANKLDIILNVGQENSIFINDQVYVDLAVRYGLDLDMYNLGFSVAARYYNDVEIGNTKVERDMGFKFALENEFIFTDNFTVGLDLFYALNGDVEYNVTGRKSKIDSFDTYGFNIDANYGLNENNFIGVYFGMEFYSDFGEDFYTDPMEYNFGIKYTTQF